MKRLLFLLLVFIGVNQSFGQSLKDTVKLKEVEVSATLPYQATPVVPITFKNITQKDLLYRNYGQEPSQILNNTPSITSYSDAGSGWGYSYIRLRGIDQTRINMTLNGVPLNEPEDQGCYFSNYPDFLQSIKIMQIQRGTGMTKNGVSSFAGSLNFESVDAQKNHMLDFGFGFGSYNSEKYSLGLGVKNFYARGSTIFSDGYKDHSSNESKSVFFITNHKYKKNNFKFLVFSGNQKNELGWLGATKEQLNNNPKYNACSRNENDDFSQTHLQLHHTYTFNVNSSLNTCLYYNHLKGWYTYQYDPITYSHVSIDTFGMIDKYNLKSNMYGFYTNYIYRYKRLNIYTGLSAQKYERSHNGQTWNDVKNYQYRDFDFEYFNTGYRNEASAFFKMVYNLGKFNIFHDFQYRYSEFTYKGDIHMDDMNWKFFNPTFGIERNIGKTILYYSLGKTNREPTRNDIFMGMDNLYTDSSYVKMKYESVYDHELGFRYLKDKVFALNMNLYYMKFKNEITLNGKIGPTGLVLHDNVDNSFRSGLEIDMKWCLGIVDLVNNSSFSYNKIKQDGIEFQPVLTPNILINQDVLYTIDHYTFILNGRYQGESYIDFSNEHKIPDYFCTNLSFKASFDDIEFNLFINNILNQKYYTYGLMDWDGATPLYFRQAPTNWFFNFKVKI